MRLQKNDLESYCNAMRNKTDSKYGIIPHQNGFWSRTLEVINNETQEKETIVSMVTTREAYEYMRAFYRGMEFQKSIEK